MLSISSSISSTPNTPNTPNPPNTQNPSKLELKKVHFKEPLVTAVYKYPKLLKSPPEYKFSPLKIIKEATTNNDDSSEEDWITGDEENLLVDLNTTLNKHQNLQFDSKQNDIANLDDFSDSDNENNKQSS